MRKNQFIFMGIKTQVILMNLFIVSLMMIPMIYIYIQLQSMQNLIIEHDKMMSIESATMQKMDHEMDHVSMKMSSEEISMMGAMEQFEQVKKQAAELTSVLILLVLVILVIVYLLGYILAKSFTKPILILQENTSKIARGQLEQKIDITRKDELGNLARSFSSMRDVIKQKIHDLKHLTLHDSLTELPNRVLFHDRLAHLLQMATRDNKEFAVISIDLRTFKAINDNHGHQIGDEVLREVARRIPRVLRSGDTLARMGGDEFSVLLPTVNAESSEQIAKKILNALNEPMIFNHESILISANLGIVLFPKHGADLETLFKHADMAMYEAKHSDEGFCLFSNEISTKKRIQMQLSSELEQAVADGQFLLHYQPIINLKTRRIKGVEALVRWEHPSRGMISPLDFITLAERTGSIKPLTHWVLKTACNQCLSWQEKGHTLTMSINLSGRLFNDPTLPDRLQEVLFECHLDARWVNLEITESTVMAHPEEAMKILYTINGSGFTVSIDDFGTGHSSFAYLTRLPVHELKIDRSFLLDMNEASRVVIRSIIDLAHSLKLTVVAEGIENREILTLLTEMGCDYAQGFYMSKPLTTDKLNDWLVESEWGLA